MKHSIVIKNKSEEIIKEMLDKVDFDTFKKVACSYVTKEQAKKVTDDVINKYLDAWAKAKYEFYVMFGNSFTLSKEIKIEINPKEVEREIANLKKEFLIYSPVISMFSTKDIINNVCPKNEQLEKYCSEYYKPGMKVSKFLSKYFQDIKFDIQFSKILQNKLTKGEVAVSINPVDYLMCSINKNNWNSCYEPKGCYCTAPFSILLDESTMICFNRVDKIYQYEISGSEFSYYSNRSRSFAIFNKSTCQFAITRSQGSAHADVVNEWKRLIVDCVTSHIGLEEEYVSDLSNYSNTNHLHHIDDDISTMRFGIKGSEKVHTTYIGAENIFNLVTGTPFNNSRTSLVG